MRSEMAGKDERRAARLSHVARRLEYRSPTVTRMTPVKRAAQVMRQHRRHRGTT
jgi:hypothetical protein